MIRRKGVARVAATGFALAGLVRFAAVRVGILDANADRPAAIAVELRAPLPAAREAAQTLITTIADAETRDDFAPDRLERAFGVKLTQSGKEHRYVSPDLGSGWKFVLDTWDPDPPGRRSLGFGFYNKSFKRTDVDAICAISTQELVDALTAAGYEMVTTVGEVGQFVSLDFQKNDIKLSVLADDVLVSWTGKQCIKEIGVDGS